MMRIPCKDCISLPMCMGIFSNYMRNSYVMEFQFINTLIAKCDLMKQHVNKIHEQPLTPLNCIGNICQQFFEIKDEIEENNATKSPM